MKLSKKSGIIISAAVGAFSAAATVGYLLWKKKCANKNCCKLEETAENIQDEIHCTESCVSEPNCGEAESTPNICDESAGKEAFDNSEESAK